MATEQECRTAIETIIERLDGAEADSRRGHIPDRTIGCTLLDLDVTFVGRLHEGRLVDLQRAEEDARPQIRLICTSDDLVALTNGHLNFAHAWATGRLRLDATLRDLMRLRALA